MDTTARKIWQDDANVEKLKSMWAEGYSAELIAREIPGATRNAVVGKVFRMGLSSRPTTNGQPHRRYGLTNYGSNLPRQPSIYRKKGPRVSGSRDAGGGAISRIRAKQRDAEIAADEGVVAIDLPPDQSEHAVLLMERQDSQCPWPLGEPAASMMVCGSPRANDRPYCGRHCRLAFRAEATRKSRADSEIRSQEMAREHRAAAFLGTR